MAAAMYVALSDAACDCGPTVQPPHAVKCSRCRGLEEFDRLRLAKEQAT
jgi:hypothetical protein